MSKKRKHQRRLVASSEEDDEISFEQDFTRDHKSVRKKAVVKSQVNFERSIAEEREQSSSSALKDDSPHQVRKHLHTLTKTKPTKQRPVYNEISYRESRSGCAHVSSSKTENLISKKEYSIKRSKTRERTPSNSIYTKHRDTVLPSVKTSKVRSKEETSRHSPSTSQKQQSTSSLVSAEQEERIRHLKKKKCNAEVPLLTGKYCSAIGTKWSPSTSSKDVAQQNKEELLKKNGKIHQTKVFEDKKRSCTDAKHSPYSSTKKSSKNTFTKSMSDTTVSDIKSDLQKTSEPSSSQKQIHSLKPSSPIRFKIPKKILKKTVEPIDEKSYGIPKKTNLKNKIRLPGNEGAFHSNQETAHPLQSSLGVAPLRSLEGPSASSSLQFPVDDNTCSDQQINVAEQLYLARSQRTLEVNVMESYGELTCMDIDLPEEGSANTQCKQHQLDLILVLDTNILLSHLDYVKRISSEGLNALGFPHILIPWVVLQELDSLKKGRGLSGSVAHLAIPAISYIYNSLRSRKPNIWGQSMQQAAERRNGLNAENNDDRVLQCCLQYQMLYPECALILCTNDKNLCSKALLSGVKALGIDDLKTEAERSQVGIHLQQHIEGLVSPPIKSQVSSPTLRSSCSQVQLDVRERGGFSAQFKEIENTQLCKANEDRGKCNLSQSISEFEDCLREVLSDVLEVEMKAIYEDLWTEIVFLKPPWTLQDVLKCFRKHWVAVFRYILPKSSEETIVNLINFFNSGNNGDLITTSKILEEARELVKMFQDRSSLVPRVLSIMDKVFTKLHPQEPQQIVEEDSSTFDVVMIDDDGSGGHDNDEAEKRKQSPTCHVSHQEVWTMFESIWNVVVQTSMEVFKALNFDTQTMQSAQSVRDSVPPQDALACLHKLSAMVSQLLQGFSSVLSSTPDIHSVQTLLSIIQSYKIAGLNSNVTAKDLLDCFLQPEYREKLQLGGRQLVDLQGTLNCCAHSFTSWR